MKNQSRILLSAVAACCLGSFAGPAALAADPNITPIIYTQWTAASGGNDHYYALFNTNNISFPAAVAAAGSLSYQGLTGHLAVFEGNLASYTAEESFVYRNVYTPNRLADQKIYWLGAYDLNETVADRYSNWNWVDGSAAPTSVTTTWNIDVNEGEGYNGAAFYSTNSTTMWDYTALGDPLNAVAGYVVEFQAVPEPAAIAPASLALLLLKRRR